MLTPKGYNAEYWTPQEIMTDQHLRICSLEERIRKLRKQRDDARRQSNAELSGRRERSEGTKVGSVLLDAGNALASESTEGEVGFCWCGFCRTKRMVRPHNARLAGQEEAQ